ncbi:MAG: hypothetical protein KC643_31765 [Nitrospira sp.]|nr:hypothetical protein [Nitrospira sp.]
MRTTNYYSVEHPCPLAAGIIYYTPFSPRHLAEDRDSILLWRLVHIQFIELL